MKQLFDRFAADIRNGIESALAHIMHVTESEFESLRKDTGEAVKGTLDYARSLEDEIKSLERRLAALEGSKN